MTHELLLAQKESRSLNLRRVIYYTVDSVTLLDRTRKQISSEKKERLKPVLNEDKIGLCGKNTAFSECLFGEKFFKSMRETKENCRHSKTVIITTSSFGKLYKNNRTGSNYSYDHGESSTRISVGYSLNFQG